MADEETKPAEDEEIEPQEEENEGTEPKEEEEEERPGWLDRTLGEKEKEASPTEEPQEEEPKEEIKKVEVVETTGKPIEKAALGILDGLAERGLDQVKDEKVREYLHEVWGDLKDELPDLFYALVGDGEIVLGGKYLEATKAILKKMQDDILSFKAGHFDKIDFEEIIEIRRAAIFSLYNAQRISQVQPSLQKFLSAAGRIAEIILKKGVPYILALV